MFLSNTNLSVSMVETLRLPVTPSKVCSSCKQYRTRITKLEAQVAQYKNMFKEMTKSFDPLASIDKMPTPNDDEVLRIPDVIAKNLQIPNYKFCNQLAKCKDIDFRLDKFPDDQLEIMSKEIARLLRELFIEYFTDDFSLQSATLTEIYIILKSIYRTRFGQSSFPLISQSLRTLIEKFSPINPAKIDNPEAFNFAQDFDKEILLSDVYPCAAFYQDLHTVRDQEYKLAYGEAKANPSEVMVANLLYGHAQDNLKRFERDMYVFIGRHRQGSAFKAAVKSQPHVFVDLDYYASQSKHPAYENLYDILSCRASFTELPALEECYDLISRRYQVIRVRNRLDSHQSNVTLNIIYNQVIAEVQLIYGTVGSEYETNLVNQMINSKNIQELYNLIHSWSSYEHISYSDTVYGKVIDTRPLEESDEKFTDHVLEFPITSDNLDDAGNFYRVIKSKEYGFPQSKTTTWRDNLDEIKGLDTLLTENNKLFVKRLSRVQKSAYKPENDTTEVTAVNNDDIIEVSGYFTQQHGLTSIQIKTHSHGTISKGESKTGEFFSITPPSGYHIIGFGGTRSNDGAIRTLYCLVSSLRMKRYYADRSWYEGDWKDGQRQGIGCYEDAQGNRYEGDWKNDQKTGVGLFLEAKGEITYGEYINDFTNGNVVHLKKSGVMMHNHEINGRRHGYSCALKVDFSEEAKYESDIKSGFGVIIDGNNIQQGNFINNRFKFGLNHDANSKVEKSVSLSNGDVFTGLTRLGGLVGYKGKLEARSKSLYEGKFSNSLRNGRGKFFDSVTQETYEGEWKEDKRHGNGVLTYRNGDKLYARWINDRVDSGELGTVSGETILIEYHDGNIIDGIGSRLFNKIYYYGGFKNSKFEGKGTLHFQSGDIFESEWVNGVPNGAGTYTTSTGQKYEGAYKEGNLISGQGIVKVGNTTDEFWIGKHDNEKKAFLQVKNDYKYEGPFDANFQPHGKGLLTFSHGEVFEGEWKSGVMSGNGKLTFVNGERIEGAWKKGVLEGSAKYYLKSGEVLEGNYELGRFVSGKSVLYLDKSFSKSVGPNGTEIFFSLHKPRFEGECRKGRILKGNLTFPDGTKCELDKFGYGLKAKIQYKEGLRYEGDWSWPQGRHGQGKMFDHQNNSYFCEFVDNKATNGKTVFWDAHGYIHIGQVINSSKEGPYKWATPDGRSFDGSFKSNQIYEGFGVQTYHHKFIYEGTYSNGMRHGKAVVRVVGGDQVLNGEWKEDRPYTGSGFKRFFVKDFYEGEFKDGRMHGKGVYHFESGMKFEGQWKDDRKEGLGSLHLLDGYAISSKYQDGLPVGEVTVKNSAGLEIYNESEYTRKLIF